MSRMRREKDFLSTGYCSKVKSSQVKCIYVLYTGTYQLFPTRVLDPFQVTMARFLRHPGCRNGPKFE
eukprot:COSAG02_NODE_90_length_37755_cov_29.833364_25_plen_67_part_00